MLKLTISSNFISFISISFGAVFGSLVRFSLNNNLLANLLGSFILGIVSGRKSNRRIKLFFAAGLCGSLTSFSGWVNSMYNFLSQGIFIKTILIAFASIVIGLFVASFGYFLGSRLKF